jgi:hypothetical protein
MWVALDSRLVNKRTTIAARAGKKPDKSFFITTVK